MRFPCLREPPGSYEICDVCGWEDDNVQLTHPTMGGGANSQSLFDAQRHALSLVPLELRIHEGLVRAADWRPLQPSDLGLDRSPRDGREYFDAAAGDAIPYYWQVSGPHTVEAILADVDVRAPGKSNLHLWVPEQLSFKNEIIPQDLAMALLLDRLLAHGMFPAGFEQHFGGRVYHYNSTG